MLEYVRDTGGRFQHYKASAGDCVIRSIVIITGRDYKAVYDDMARRARAHGFAKTGDPASARRDGKYGDVSFWHVQQECLRAHGFVQKAPPPRNFTLPEAWETWGDCICIDRRHATAIKDGACRDSFDARWKRGSYEEVWRGYREAWVWEDKTADPAPVRVPKVKVTRTTPAQRAAEDLWMLRNIRDEFSDRDVWSTRDVYHEDWTDRKNDTVFYRLKDKGYIRTSRCAYTRRIELVRVTPAGAAYLAALEEKEVK